MIYRCIMFHIKQNIVGFDNTIKLLLNIWKCFYDSLYIYIHSIIYVNIHVNIQQIVYIKISKRLTYEYLQYYILTILISSYLFPLNLLNVKIIIFI